MSRRVVYLDNAATTKVAPEVAREMLPYFTRFYANPETEAFSSLAVESSRALEEARGSVARLLGVDAREVYFTSGGSEADNWALKGIAFAHKKRGNHIITSAIEHKAILRSAEFLRKLGFKITFLKVDKWGQVNPEDVRRSITDKTILVSIMHANNEIGTLQPIEEISQICREYGVLFHSDVVQSVPHRKVNLPKLGVQLASVAAHKFYGPKGVGALYIKEGIEIESLIHAGGQERGKRGSTHNVPGIVGMGKAAELLMEKLDEDNERVNRLAERLKDAILSEIPDSQLNGHPTQRISGNLSFTFKDAPSENILLMLNHSGIIAAGGSACNAKSGSISHVLTAIGDKLCYNFGAVRFSIGRYNTEADIERVIKVLPRIVRKIRRLAY